MIVGNCIKANTKKFGVVTGICFMRWGKCFLLSYWDEKGLNNSITFEEKDVLMVCNFK